MYKVEFTEEELKALMQLIDLAVRADGMRVAQAGVLLTQKLQNAEPLEPPKDD